MNVAINNVFSPQLGFYVQKTHLLTGKVFQSLILWGKYDGNLSCGDSGQRWENFLRFLWVRTPDLKFFLRSFTNNFPFTARAARVSGMVDDEDLDKFAELLQQKKKGDPRSLVSLEW